MLIEQALTKIMNGRELISKALANKGVLDIVRRGVGEVLKLINVPTRSDIGEVEKKLLRVERDLDKVARQILKKRVS